MIVSKKDGYNIWKNLKGYASRLSGPYYGYRVNYYKINDYWHNLYERSIKSYWDLNHKSFEKFKEV